MIAHLLIRQKSETRGGFRSLLIPACKFQVNG